MKPTIAITAYIGLALLIFSGPALAQDRCSDILLGGTFSREDFQTSHTLNELLAMRYARSSTADETHKSTLDLGVVVDGTPLGLDSSDEGTAHRRETLSRSLDYAKYQYDETAFALTSGDEVVVNGWLKYISQGVGGLRAYFTLPDKNDPHLVELTIEWVGIHGWNSVKLDRDISLPTGVTVVENPKCRLKGATLTHGVPCPIRFKVPSAWFTWSPLITTSHGHGEPYLPPRIRLTYENEPEKVPVDPKFQVSDYASGDNDRRSFGGVIAMDDGLRKVGWNYHKQLPEPIDQMSTNASNRVSCGAVTAVYAPTQVTLSSVWDSSNKGQGLTCMIQGTVWRERFHWVGIDGSEQPPPAY